MGLKKPSAALKPGAGCDVSPPTGGWPGRERLWEFLVTGRYEDGCPRQLPTVMLFLHDGRLTAALNDRDNERTAFVSGKAVEDVLDALERGLEDDSLGWRPNKPQGKGRR